MEKTVKYANSVIEALKQEYIDGIIKDFCNTTIDKY